MPEQKIELLERALARQKMARQQAERILESKSKELFDLTRQLKEANQQLESLLSEKTSELQGVFVNIVDPYVVMDLAGNAIRMNAAAKEFLGFDHEKTPLNLASLVHPEFVEYTRQSMEQLLKTGSLKNYTAKITLADGSERHVQINSSLIYDRESRPVAAQGIIRDITKEREVDEILRRQKRQLDIIVGNSPVGIALTENGRYIRCNETFSRMLGYAEKEIIGSAIKKFTAPEDYAESLKLIESLNKGECDQVTQEKRYLRKDGVPFLAKTTVNAVTDSQGRVSYHVAVIEDITQQREAEQKIVASENRLATLISNLHMGVLLEDENGRISLTNQHFCNLFGIEVPPESLRGMDCAQAAEASQTLFSDGAAFMDRIREIQELRQLVQGDELEMKDGRILERDYIPINSGGVYQGHLWTYTDVTLRRNYRRNLEQQKEKYSSIIANMNLGLIEVDLEDRVQLVNQSFCQMSGYTREQIIGRIATDILKIRTPELIKEKNRERTRGVSDSYEVEVYHPDGSTRHWLISGAPRYDEAGMHVGSIGIHLDITEQKHLEMQKEALLLELQQSNEGLQEYAHIVSHDLKSPLRSISALASWLKEDFAGKIDEGGMANLDLMQEKVAGMDSLIEGILHYSSIGNQPEERAADVELAELIDEICRTIFIPEHVNVKVKGHLPPVFGDRTKLQQLFQNLIANAVQHIDRDNGLVEVSCRDRDTHWEFAVRDNGVGIPEAYHKRIFEIFESVDTLRKGSGIGLAIVKKIVTLYGGEIWLESVVGEGTVFYFTLKKQVA